MSETTSATRLWTGRILSGIAVAFLLLDALGKLVRVPQAIEGSVTLGYPERAVVPIGVLLLAGVVLYVIPRTSLLGAIYLAAYLGGAVVGPVPRREPARHPRPLPGLRRGDCVGRPRAARSAAPGAPEGRPVGR